MGLRPPLSTPVAADTILFVCLAGGLGGSTRSLATVLGALDGSARRVLAGPSRGRFPRFVEAKQLADVTLTLPRRDEGGHPLLARGRAVARVMRFARANRHRLLAIHANGPEEVSVAAPAALFSGVPLVVWSHAWAVPPSARRLGPLWRRLLRRHNVHWAAVSTLAARRLAEGGLVRTPDDVEIIPNPIDPADVLAPARRSDGTTVGFLGSADLRKGVDLLAPVMTAVGDAASSWALYTPRNPDLEHVWSAIEAAGVPVDWFGLVPDVRDAYAHCDVVFCPSREESFCRVAAEAMLNGIPVVASDIEAVREVVGPGGLMVPVGDTAAAGAALRGFLLDAARRERVGELAREQARGFEPAAVVAALGSLYGLAV